MTPEEYMEHLDLLDVEEIKSVFDQLHAAERGSFTAEDLYVNSKLPFGFNYIDCDLDITHDNDSMSEHGSHVAGIAAANAYIPNEDGTFDFALDSVFVQGVAPDAQIITMKVFGKNGGAYSSDYMAAIEDAIVLGCDAINLSLGSTQPGFAAIDSLYESKVQSLMESGAVISVSAGNAYAWSDFAANGGYLYGDDVNLHTSGTPGTWPISLAVASAENIGYTANYFTVAGNPIFYTEPNYQNEPMGEVLSGEVEYVYLEIPGGIMEFDHLKDIIQGRVVVCPRGDTSFWEKATGAANNGAIGTVIYNTQPGVMYMNLYYYPFYEPCVAITQEAGALMKENSVEYVHESGEVYRIGKLEVNGLVGVDRYEDSSVLMSSFSSWGVPGDLTMKPEITAPGGDIYSVYGSNPDGGGSDRYETMSGTSMSSPQIAGMSALMAQYIEENDLEEKTGLSKRQLSQSLLMSTAVPIADPDNAGMYYSVLNQGAGLANVGAAVSAGSYILMDEAANATAADGKVKVELGQDPQREGVYSFSFSLNNLTSEAQSYELSASFFTQALSNGMYDDGTSVLLLEKTTAPLNTTVTWTVNGAALDTADSVRGMDFDDDGDVDELDGTALLEYAAEIRSEIANVDKADLDADADVDSYDAYLFFTRFSAGTLVLAAEDTAEITVTVSLTAEQKAHLDEYYADGAYLEGFVFARELTGGETEGTSHSIPVLGYYGDWSDPSMFEIGSYSAYRTGDETRIPYSGDVQTNNISITYGNTPGTLYYYGGNFVVADETYHPERNAINSENGDMIGRAFFAPIRNVAASRFTITDNASGELLYDTYPGATPGAYYHSSAGAWLNTNQSVKLNWAPSMLEEGDSFTMTMTLAPETHADSEGNVDWESLGRGTSISMPMTIDNTAPTLEAVYLDLMGSELVVKASDNQYIAGAVLFDGSGNYILRRTGSIEDIRPGETGEYHLSLQDINGTKFMLQVIDYAYNKTTYMIEQNVGEAGEIPQFIAFVYKPFSWVSFGEEDPGEYTFWKSVEERIYAATMVDNMIYYSTINGNLGVFNAESNYEEFFISELGWYPGDMAYNPVDGYIYAVLNINKYSLKDPIVYTLLRIDKMTGQVTVVGSTPVLTNALAIDGSGTFYCNEYETGDVYSFTLDDLTTAKHICTITESEWPLSLQAMEWDYNIDALRWCVYHEIGWDCYCGLVTIDPETGTYTYKDAGYESYNGLAIPTKGAKTGSWAAITDKISMVSLNHTEAVIPNRSELVLTANVLPWTVTDRTVTWSSSDPSVATVDAYGRVTALSAGEVTITATATLDPTVSASCHITVEPVEMTISGITRDASGSTRFFQWDMETESARLDTALDCSIIAGTAVPGREEVYVVDDTDGVWSIRLMDKATGQTVDTPDFERFRTPLMDIAFNSCYTGIDGEDRISGIHSTYYFPSLDPMEPNEMLISDMSSKITARGGTRLIAVASAGQGKYSRYDAEHVYLLDDAGNMWDMYVYTSSNGKMYTYAVHRPTDLLDTGLELASLDPDSYSYSSMIVGEDGALYLSVFNGLTCDLFRLTYVDSAKRFDSCRLGTIGEGPTTLTGATSNQTAESPAAIDPEEYEQIPMVVMEDGLNSCTDRLTTEDDNTIVVDVVADEASTNGVVTVSYDADLLALDSADICGDYHVISDDAGTVTFGYVSLGGICTGDTIAQLRFQPKVCAEAKTMITVTRDQCNNSHPAAQETLRVTLTHANTEVRDAIAATCTTAGYTGDTYCTDCGKLIAKGEIIEALGHDYATETVAPTCTDHGYTTYTCTVCGDSYTADFVAPYCASARFTDVALDDWFHEAVDYVAENKLMVGVSATAFDPEGVMNRSQIVTVLYRMASSPEVTEAAPFSDVVAGSFYADAVAWATANGITTGVSADKFNPNGSVTREQMVTFLYRYVKFTGADMTVSGDLSAFEDAASVSTWAVEAMTWAVEKGLISGVTATTLEPTSTTNRAQVATVLMRMGK